MSARDDDFYDSLALQESSIGKIRIWRRGCKYLARPESICNKCGKQHRDTIKDIRDEIKKEREAKATK